ncbi:MAG: hypothetical protein KIS94_15200 [Chitinophagales bacterium]|nr:hypothetical protein [Chitinophagales bacterium]
MHFLSHYYTELPNNNALFVVALGIPDLTSGFARVYNAKLKNAVVKESHENSFVHEGIMKHFEADKRFHQSPAFNAMVKQCTAAFVNEGLNRERLRLSVIAHLAVEMMLDRQIVIQHADVCNRYYQLLGNAAESSLTSYFENFGLENEKKVFLERFTFFKARKYLLLFNEIENIVFGLNRIYGNVTRTNFTDNDTPRFAGALHNIDNIMRYRWQEILTV